MAAIAAIATTGPQASSAIPFNEPYLKLALRKIFSL